MTLKQQVTLWIFSGICGVIFLYLAFLNGYMAVQGMRGKRGGSLIPLIGGICGAFSLCGIFEVLGIGRPFRWFVFTPMILDMGCLPLLVNCVIFLIFSLISYRGPKS